MGLLLLWQGPGVTTNPRTLRRSVGYRAGPSLFAARYDVSRTTLLENFSTIANFGARWALPGGLQRAEITIRAKSRLDAYQRYRDHLGQGMVVYDQYGDRPIVDGWAYEIIPDGIHVHYIVGGSWKRHTDEHETDNPSAGTDDTDVYLKALLTAHVGAAGSDQDNIDATGLDIGEAFKVDEIVGTQPDRIAKTLLTMGTSTDGEIIDYWLVPQRFDKIYPQLPKPYFAVRDFTISPNWLTKKENLRRLSLSRNIWNLANDVQIGYTPATTIDGAVGDGAAGFDLSSATGFNEGDEISIQLGNPAEDKYWTTMIQTLAGVTVTTQDVFPQGADDDNRVESRAMQLTSAATDSTSQSDYWTREYRDKRTDMEQTQAEAYRDLSLESYKNPVQKASFTIGSGFVRDGRGARWPVWRMLINPGTIRIDDFLPASELFSDSLDRLRSFRIVGIDYDHSGRSMRVTPDAYDGDNRIDVLLQQAGFNIGQMVQRG